MKTLIDRLLALRVADVMARNIVTVGESQPLGEVACTLASHDVSCAPVLDDQGRCTGVISAWDFVKHHCEDSQRGCHGKGASTLTAMAEGRCISAAEEFAGYNMSPAMQTIEEGASLLRAARVMSAQHVHHLFVLDDHCRPLGVVSTMDITAAVVNAFDEMEAATAHRART
jgi:CBS-domain-containing membrane protein